MSSYLNTPVLFLIFNRPASTELVFEQIRKVQPKQLFISADGPRKDKLGEQEKCELSRNIVINSIDWMCEVKTLFRSENLGCGKAVSSAISWFFENVEEGIIIEDDCLPDLSFFQYCSELLEKYKLDQRVMLISGSNLLGKSWKDNKQSYFWGHTGIWGWATWKRAWRLYDFKIGGWNDEELRARIKDASKTEKWFNFFYPMLESTYNGTLDTWDVQWVYSIFIHGGLSANPAINLVKNIGFTEEGTHTNDINSPITKLESSSMVFPLIHPKHMVVDVEYLDLMYDAIHHTPVIVNDIQKGQIDTHSVLINNLAKFKIVRLLRKYLRRKKATLNSNSSYING